MPKVYLTLLIGILSSTLHAQYYVWKDPTLNRVEAVIDSRDFEQLKNCIDSIHTANPTFYNKHLDFFLRANGNHQSLQQNYTEAFKLYFDGLKLAERLKNEPEIALSKMELGLVFIHFEEPQLAIKLFDEAEAIFRKLDNKSLINRCCYLRAVSYKRLGEFEKSNAILRKTLASYRSLRDSVGIAEANNAIGLNYKNMKQAKKAIPYFEESIVLFGRFNKKADQAKAYNNLANIYQMLEQWDAAIEQHNNSLKIKGELKDTLGIAVSYINLSVIYKKTNRFDLAISFGLRSINLLEILGPTANQSLITIYGLMSELFEKTGNQTKALEFSRLENKLNQQLRIEEEAMLIDLFEKKQDVKFYTISDSLLKTQKELETKFQAAKTENESLSRQKSYVILFSLIIVVLLLLGIAIMNYWRYKSTKIIKDELEVTNQELYETRIGEEEKEVLLQEIHHRVKNNMQIISSLIRLQSNQVEDEKTQNLFKETQHRINSMALVHEQLYHTKDFEKLELSGYLSALTEHLVSSYRGNKNIEYHVDVNFGKASINAIIPIGLIVNEIISNSLKHAFADRETGCIKVRFNRMENSTEFLLEISDNGVGVNGEMESKSDEPSDTLGLELIHSLTEQLDGTLRLDTSQGYHYFISIPKI